MEKRELIKIKDLSFSYGSSIVLEDLDLVVVENDFIGIIGPNGGGKTTLLKIILGLLEPDSGKIEVLGTSPRKARKKVGYVPQYSKFDEFFPITVIEVVLLGLMAAKKPGRGFTREERALALKCLEEVGIMDLAARPIGELSYGQKQRVFIARAIVKEPLILLLDEPTASVDAMAQESFYDILADLKKNMAIMLITHDMGAVSKYVEKIGCLNRKLFYHGSGEIRGEDLVKVYGCPVDLIAHGVPHRVMKEHKQ